jgi:hypothetical protein
MTSEIRERHLREVSTLFQHKISVPTVRILDQLFYFLRSKEKSKEQLCWNEVKNATHDPGLGASTLSGNDNYISILYQINFWTP